MGKVDLCPQADIMNCKMSANSDISLSYKSYIHGNFSRVLDIIKQNRLIVDQYWRHVAIDGQKLQKNCCLSKNVHNFLKNCPQAMLACLRLFPCLVVVATKLSNQAVYD